MLQIISGRFFSGGKVNEADSDAILYSNLVWIAPINTIVGELRPVDTRGSRIASYILRYTNRYEPSPKDILVLPIGDEAVEQFRLLASFFFQSFFHVDRGYVESLCRTERSHNFDTTVPKVFVPRFFDLARRAEHSQVVDFVAFIEKVLSMPRKQYRLFISCLSGFLEALEAVGRNFDLAYSIMVYTLEALSKSIEHTSPVWDDYDQNIRHRLDKQLASLGSEAANGIRSILLDNPHLKLKKRFVNFISTHVSDSYFTSEAEGLRFAVAKSELARALGNLYDARSGYVHELKQVQEQLRLHWVGADCDVYRWMNEPHFTFSGLVRLAHHVMSSFIRRQPVLAVEAYPGWRAEIPGRVSMEFAPEYWVWQPGGFHPGQARKRFSGFIDYIVTNFSQPTVLDVRPLMEPIEKLVPSAAPRHRVPMLALYWMFNGMIAKGDRRPGWDAFIERWWSDLEPCSIELVIMEILWGRKLRWPVEQIVSIFEQYQKSRHKIDATNLPRMAEIAIMADIANQFLESGQLPKYEEWISRGILDAAGSKTVQDYLYSCQQGRRAVEVFHVLGRPLAANGDTAGGMKITPVVEEEIRRRAYLKWEAAGRPECNGVDFWLNAEQELLHDSESTSASTTSGTP